ncbi:MAG: protein kinase domain-containing protein [bacterium]
MTDQEKKKDQVTEAPDGSEQRTLSGAEVGRYQVKERLGAGGMGEVYRAWDTLLERWVAVKRASPGAGVDDVARRRLLREARSASALQHHAIAGIFDVVESTAGTLLIVQELVPGVPLRKHLDTPFALDAFLSIAIDCAGALVAAAEKGIVHCDIKPENILLTDDGRPKILDFGIARRAALDEANIDARTRTIVTEAIIGTSGTPAYMAPEVIDGKTPDGRADIFALGVVFYEMLTATNPFKRETLSKTLVSVVSVTPARPSELNASLPAGIDTILAKMLAKEVGDRYASAKELVDDLRALAGGTFVVNLAADRGDALAGPASAAAAGGATSVAGAIPAAPASAPPRKRFSPAILIGAAALIAAAVAIVLVLKQPESQSPGKSVADARSTARVPYLAVEPFKNLAEDPKAEYFAVGLTEALQSRLAGIKGMYVVDAASDLGVKMTLEGGVQRSSDRLRITYRIVDREKGVSVGGGVIEGGIEELFELQDRASQEISSTLAEQFGLAPLSEPAPRPTNDVTAYDLYLQARGYLRRFEDEKNVEIAIEMFQKALHRDEEMSLALAGLGEAYWLRYEKTKDPRWAAKAEATSLIALRGGDGLAEPHVTLGTIHLGRGSPDSAAVEFARAIELDAESDAAYRGLAKAEEGLGHLTAAEQTFQKAIAARPDYWAGHNDLGSYYYRHGELEKAAECFRRVVELTPDNPRGYSNLGAMYASLKRNDDAVAAYEKSIALKPNYRAYSNLATLFQSAGRAPEAAAMYEKALALDDRDYRVWGSLGAALRGISGREAGVDSAFHRAVDLAEVQLAINPNDALLLAFLAEHHAMLNEPERAGELAERAVTVAPKQVDVLVRAANAYERIGDRTRALATIRTAIECGWRVEVPKAGSVLSSLVASAEFQSMVREMEAAKPEGGVSK